MLVPNRHGSSNSYRYGYQGSEKDDEVKGNGNNYMTHYRHLDPRVGRWMSRDPKFTAFETPYSSMSNNPILYNDKLGDTIRTTFRTGFLGIFGKKVSIDYENGKYYEAGTKNEYTGKVGNFQKVLLKSLTDINNNSKVGDMINNLVSAKNVINIEKGGVPENGGAEFSIDKNNIWKVKFDPGAPPLTLEGTGQGKKDLFFSTDVILVHELGHAEDVVKNGKVNFNTVWYTSNINNKKVTYSEVVAIHRENLYRASLNLPLREWYSPEYLKNPSTINGQILLLGTRTNLNISIINDGLDNNKNFKPFNY